MAWIALVVAGVLEIAWAVALKKSGGFSRSGWTALFAVALAGSMALLARAMRDLPAGTAYAVWTGIGAAGTALVGIAFLGEPGGWARLACVGLVVAGIVGLRIVTPG
jgi:quaternary ammonium compound-resistance protein SugE